MKSPSVRNKIKKPMGVGGCDILVTDIVTSGLDSGMNEIAEYNVRIILGSKYILST